MSLVQALHKGRQDLLNAVGVVVMKRNVKLLQLKLKTLFKLSLEAALLLPLVASPAIGKLHDPQGKVPSIKALQPAEEIKLRNWGLDNQEFDSHIHAREAWKITKGKKNIVVAVIDTGIDPQHPDLKDSLWRKKGTDEYGFDFVTNKKNPTDVHGHGTHVAGIIAASAKAAAGASGVAPNVSIMAIRYYSDSASGAVNLANTVKAIHYAIDNGADIINYSGGGSESSSAERKAIERAESKGILLVAAAGNDFRNTDLPGAQYYPAAYGLSNIIGVANTNIRNQLNPTSNWGPQHTHIAAPGDNIFSTFPNGKYGYLTGTSQATAFVSGAAALVLSENSSLSPKEVRDVLMRSADTLDTLKNKVASSGRLNAFKAVKTALALRNGTDMNTTKFAKAPTPQADPLIEEVRRAIGGRSVAFE